MNKNKRAPLTFNQDTMMQSEPASDKEKRLRKNKSTKKQGNNKTTPSRLGRQFIAAHVMPETAKQFKILALQKDMTGQELLVEAINDLFAKYKLSRIAY